MIKTPDDIKLLEEKISNLHRKECPFEKKSEAVSYTDALRTVFRITMELISGVLTGAGIGYILDYFFSTQPFMMTIFLPLGGAAGFLNVYRVIKHKEACTDTSSQEY